MGDDKRIAQAARVSTGNDDSERPHEGLVRRLWADKHTSPFEHCALTVRVEIPKRVVWEWERHRTQSYSELSTRYAVMEPAFYLPPEERPLAQQGKPMDYRREHVTQGVRDGFLARRTDHARHAHSLYMEDIRAGIALELAADHLPPYMYTRFYATANLLNWFRFLSLRTDPTALWEIRDAAHQVEAIVHEHWPVAWSAFAEK
ncbi:flavin-dependent thymidylate synthase-like [Tenebrio molitor]|uniref:flavin-dependent thymidylate synthase-like n=1 Tax=Tenebrio molitor TaxID=7067 RepID=UPI00362490B2